MKKLPSNILKQLNKEKHRIKGTFFIKKAGFMQKRL